MYNNENFDVKSLIEMKEKIREQKMDVYKKYFNICLQKIKNSSKLGYTDIIYQFPTFELSCSNYDVKECIEYVDSSLKLKFFDTLVMPNNVLFISWYYMELYIK